MAEQPMPVVLIPSLQPDDRLPPYVDALLKSGFRRVVVVDDGSGPDYDAIFGQIEQLGATVIRYPVNKGKGEALKTGFRWLMANDPGCTGVLTADADGQHTVPDCIKVAQAMLAGEDALYLGSRDFNLPDIPPKSRSGNKITSNVFKLLHGVWLPDTQTGLRCFRASELPFMAEVAGSRYEYEMNMLIAAAHRKLPMVPITIETVYENNNEGTHFHPIRDSWRIYKVILGSFLRYAVASILSWLLELLIISVLMFWVFKGRETDQVVLLGIPFAFRALVATPIARVISAPVNYLMNMKYVFEKHGSGTSVRRYVILAVCSLVITTLLFAFLDHYLGGSAPILHILLKIVIDVAMYLVNYRVQDRWVFRTKPGKA